MRTLLRYLPSAIHIAQPQMNLKPWIPAVSHRWRARLKASQPLMQTHIDSPGPEVLLHPPASPPPHREPAASQDAWEERALPHLFSPLLLTWNIDAAPSLSLCLPGGIWGSVFFSPVLSISSLHLKKLHELQSFNQLEASFLSSSADIRIFQYLLSSLSLLNLLKVS